MMCNGMSCLVTHRMSALRCSSLTVLTVPCGSLGRGSSRLPMYRKDRRISNEGKTTVGIVGMLLWSLVLLLRRVVSMANVTSAGRLGT